MDAAAVVIITGPPGAGKSTTARAVAASFPRSVHLHTDDFWHAMVSGSVPPYLPEADEQNQTVMRVISTAASAYAAGGFVVVVDGIVGPWMLHHFLDLDPGPIRSRPPLHYVVLRPSRDETLRRAQGRTEPDALVDQAPILAMWEQFSALRPLEHHVIDTTGQAPSETLTAVRAAVEAGTFLLRRNPVS
ncbi:AAA family ATPase [Curtobacterium flaccumfaciens]|uniref:AAA family ATPase n=1 Tax=Curtobacterium flaccumfaciens TaxID=2035 RepID=UPI001BDE4F63|nr:AAA family ATPase [Curtobacterium flaccumfaciens]MBT1633627.1 AAA family ATPase [Curtobacterium flaccumfaciens pv. oortii]MCX2843716.1 AAA family ATPase [Curtobacterium flaccumfaciens pv. oortii]